MSTSKDTADLRAIKNMVAFCRSQGIQSLKWRDFEAHFTLQAVSGEAPEAPKSRHTDDEFISDDERPHYRMRS